MEITITHMAGDGVDEMVLVEHFVECRNKSRTILRPHHEVVYEGAGVEAVQIFAQQGKALAAYGPVFCRGDLTPSDLGAHREAYKSAARFFGFLKRFLWMVFRKFCQEHELGDAAGCHHPRFREEGEA